MVVGVMVKGVAGFGMSGSGRAKRAMPTLAAQSARVEDGAPGLCWYDGVPDCAASDEERETAGSLAALGMTTRKASAGKASADSYGVTR